VIEVDPTVAMGQRAARRPERVAMIAIRVAKCSLSEHFVTQMSITPEGAGTDTG
jgi:hypothetical protein